MERAGGQVINNRVNGALAVSRAFGDTQFKEVLSTATASAPVGTPGKEKGKLTGASVKEKEKEKEKELPNTCVIAVPEVLSEVITPMTEFAVVATDGLWDVMQPQLVINFVRKLLLSRKGYDLQEASRELATEAIARGSVDNVTVLLMSFHMPPPSIAPGLEGGARADVDKAKDKSNDKEKVPGVRRSAGIRDTVAPSASASTAEESSAATLAATVSTNAAQKKGAPTSAVNRGGRGGRKRPVDESDSSDDDDDG